MGDRKLNEFYPMRIAGDLGLKSLITYLNSFFKTSDKTVIEIGSYVGESAMIFAKDFGFVITIDPFIDGYPADYGVSQYAEFSKVYEKFLENTKNYTNIQLIKQTSDDAISSLKDKKVDFLYIDGCHTYEQVWKDITNYKPLIVNGGFIGGHDYVSGWIGVMQAVNELLGIPDQTFVDGSWVKRILI